MGCAERELLAAIMDRARVRVFRPGRGRQRGKITSPSFRSLVWLFVLLGHSVSNTRRTLFSISVSLCVFLRVSCVGRVYFWARVCCVALFCGVDDGLLMPEPPNTNLPLIWTSLLEDTTSFHRPAPVVLVFVLRRCVAFGVAGRFRLSGRNV